SRAWFAALTLAERRAAGRPRIEPTPSGRERLARWKAQSPFDTHPELWAARLVEGGVDEETFVAILSESADDLSERVPPPDWMLRLDAALAGYARPGAADSRIARAVARIDLGYLRAALRFG